MKKFEELQKGDYIYYYDHGKIREQLVHDVFVEVDERKYTDWMGRENITRTEYLIILAGRNKKYKLYKFDKASSSTIINTLRRFSCKEAATIYLENKINRATKKIKHAEYVKNKYENIRKNYLNAAYQISTLI